MAVKAVAVCPMEQHCLGSYMQCLLSQGVSDTFVDMTERRYLCLCSPGHVQVLHLTLLHRGCLQGGLPGSMLAAGSPVGASGL